VSSLDHNRWDDDLAAYALGALDGRERSEFEAHLATCYHCQIELRWLEPALDALPASVEQLTPPPDLRKRILAAADEEVPDLGRARAQRRSWWRVGAVRPALAAAATIVAVAVGLAGGYALRGDDDGGDIVTQTIPVETATPAIQANASVVQHGDSWTLDVRDLPELRRGDVYQVWIAHGKTIRPSVLFVPSQGDRAKVALPRTMASASQLMVTREPSGGSLEPTSAPLLAATMN
jgi:anti-sigma-K factor RskA